jgi:nucleotide-binding universal stress UspA family protein
MFTQIVVPVDLSDRHQAALDLAAWLVERNRGEVTLLHIIEVIPELIVTGIEVRPCRRLAG